MSAEVLTQTYSNLLTRIHPVCTAEEISVDLLPDLVSRLSPPLGLNSKVITPAMLMEVIKDLEIPIHNNRVRYYDTFLAWYFSLISSAPSCESASFIILPGKGFGSEYCSIPNQNLFDDRGLPRFHGPDRRCTESCIHRVKGKLSLDSEPMPFLGKLSHLHPWKSPTTLNFIRLGLPINRNCLIVLFPCAV